MLVTRRIGECDVAVETSEGEAIYLLGATAAEEEQVAMTKKALLRKLARDGTFTPLTCQWEILDRCNLACPFCYIVGHSNNKVVRYEEIETHIDDLVEAGMLFCTLTGGDPLIHPDFDRIYRRLKEGGVVTSVFTNGIAITDRVVELFCELPPREVEVSIYTMDNKHFRDAFKARAEDASRVLDNILKLKKAGVAVSCKTFVNTITQGEVEEIKAWSAQENIEHYTSTDVTAAYDGEDLKGFGVEPLYPIGRAASPRPARTYVGLPCDTKLYGGAIDSSFRFSPCPAVRHETAFLGIRELGVKEVLRRTLGFVRLVQDMEITQNPGNNPSTCLAKAEIIHGERGEIVGMTAPQAAQV